MFKIIKKIEKDSKNKKSNDLEIKCLELSYNRWFRQRSGHKTDRKDLWISISNYDILGF